jgi:ubiquinone/menaquinone biosynthesis C-methylase UbiE
VDASVINPFVGEAVAARYASSRPSLHHHAVRLLADRLPRQPHRALDVGCGTGLSTRPLNSLASIVVGIDGSEAMLRERLRGDSEHYVRAVAERLPFRDAAFDLATIASAIHWLDPESIEEIGRVLAPRASVAIYDVWFRGEMRGLDAFTHWMARTCGPRYPRVPKHEHTEESMSAVGLKLVWEEDLRFDVVMTLEQLVNYLMTHSERITAVREGIETEAQQSSFLAEGLEPFFAEADSRGLGFGIQVVAFER